MIRNCSITAATLATLTACSMAPAPVQADGKSPRLPMPPLRSEPIRQPPKPLPPLSYRYDADGLVVSYQDRRFAPLAVPAGYKRFGGGLAFDYAGAAARNGNNNGGNLQTGGNGGGNNGCGNGNGGPNGGKNCDPKPPKPPKPEPPTPPDSVPGVPGPVGALGLGAAFAYSRRLRQRIK